MTTFVGPTTEAHVEVGLTRPRHVAARARLAPVTLTGEKAGRADPDHSLGLSHTHDITPICRSRARKFFCARTSEQVKCVPAVPLGP